MLVKIFWRKGCPKCPRAKELGKKLTKEGIEVNYYNLDEAEGLSEGTTYAVMGTPTVIVVDEKNKEVASWRGKSPSESEIKKYL
jgi:glutaredoxin